MLKLRWYDKVYDKALADIPGKKKLNVTRSQPCSSFLEPNFSVIEKHLPHPIKLRNFEVERQVEVDCTTLVEAATELSVPDYLQIDTQGFEKKILEGAASILSRITIIEVEVVFHPLYKNQPTFDEIHKFLDEKGFNLFLLDRQGKFGYDLVEANACFYNRRLFVTDQAKTEALINLGLMKYKKFNKSALNLWHELAYAQQMADPT